MKGFLVCGTDTEVGKTYVSCQLIRGLIASGKKVAAMKPIASGCDLTADGLRNADALALIAASNIAVDYSTVNPFAAAEAISPHLAFTAEPQPTLAVIESAFRELQRNADLVLVEGAGGWESPLSNLFSHAEMCRQLKLPVIMVVGIRLGCINHAVLTARAIKADGCELIGWIANDLGSGLARRDETISTIAQRIDAPMFDLVPFEISKNYEPTVLVEHLLKALST